MELPWLCNFKSEKIEIAALLILSIGMIQPFCISEESDQEASINEESCFENARGTLPDEVEWIILDGKSSRLYSFADMPLLDYEGYYGTYDLNTEEVYGANGFLLEAPATIYGASVRWANLSEEPTPASLYIYPDFGSDGYAFDIWNAMGPFSLCLTSDDEEEWVTYLFPEPLEITQPLYIFVGYHRLEVEKDDDGNPIFTEPELLFENSFNDEEPFYTGVRWPHVEKRLYYGGMISPFYIWQVRLAVIYHDDIPAEDKPFRIDENLSASSRVAWGDYDDDGDDDLMTNGPTLYRNNGDGTFTDVTDSAIPQGTINSSNGGVFGDYDNDGCLDYFGQGGGYDAGEVLLHNNCDGTFTDVTMESGIDDTQTERDCNGDGFPEYSPTEGSAWFDYDGDGFLDLYLANYECSSEYDYYLNYDDRLFRNNGDGTFVDVTEEAGVETSNQAGRGVTTGDYDIDGDTDLFVSNYRLDRNFFYENNGDGTLENIASSNGTMGDCSQGYCGHTIGSVFGDIDNDGDFDLITANLAHPFYYDFSDKTMVLINDGNGNFSDEAEERGIYYRETHSNPILFDADNDGDLDLFITCVYPFRQSDFYKNDGNGYFTLANYESGLVVENGWGSAASDYDNDGDIDIVAYNLFRNDTKNANNWIEVKAVGIVENISAIGAVIEVETEGLKQLRMVSGGSGTGCQDSFIQHFGLASADTVERITVHFPYGNSVTVEDIPSNQRITIFSDGTYTSL